VRVLVGYFKSNEKSYLKPPALETDALAGEHGGNEVLIPDAATLAGLPSVNVHALTYAPGRHKIDLRGEGAFLIFGIVQGK
jgi:hypothetical protein